MITPSEVPVQALRQSLHHMRRHHVRGLDPKTLDFSFKRFLSDKEKAEAAVEAKKEAEAKAKADAEAHAREVEMSKHKNLAGVVVSATSSQGKGEDLIAAGHPEVQDKDPHHHKKMLNVVEGKAAVPQQPH